MGLGITGANITSLVNGTVEDGPTVTANFNNLKTWGINNDGVVQTDGSGNVSGLVSLAAQFLNVSPTAVTVNGSTAGTATLYQFLQGTVKAAFIVLNGFHNGAIGDANLLLPTAFTAHCLFWSGDSGQFDLKLSGALQTIWTRTGFPSSAGNAGANGSATSTNANCDGHCDAAFDTVGLYGSSANTYNGSIFLIGV